MQCFLELCHHSNKLYKKWIYINCVIFLMPLLFFSPLLMSLSQCGIHVSLWSQRSACFLCWAAAVVPNTLYRVSRVTSATQKLPVFGMTRPSAQTGTDSMLKKLLSRNKFAPLLRTVSPGTHHCLRPEPRETNSESLTCSQTTQLNDKTHWLIDNSLLKVHQSLVTLRPIAWQLAGMLEHHWLLHKDTQAPLFSLIYFIMPSRDQTVLGGHFKVFEGWKHCGRTEQRNIDICELDLGLLVMNKTDESLF